MEYFILKMSSELKNPIVPSLLGVQALSVNPDMLEDYSIGYYERNGKEYSDILTAPLFLVTEQVKELMQLYDEEIYFKGVQLFAKDKTHEPLLYYTVQPYKADCLHKSVRINPNGTVNEVVLEKSKIPKKDIFVLEGLKETRMVISLRMAESLLRRELYGIGLEAVVVRGKDN